MSGHACLVPHSSILVVGQDVRGRWLVQDEQGLIEGCFSSRETALGFARSESDIYHTAIEISSAPLTSRFLH
jgi:hypothetical protein